MTPVVLPARDRTAASASVDAEAVEAALGALRRATARRDRNDRRLGRDGDGLARRAAAARELLHANGIRAGSTLRGRR